MDASPPPTSISYARARLWLGISGVGTFVLLAAVLLSAGIPAASRSAGEDTLLLLEVVVVFAAISAPFDVLGGFVLPRRYDRTREAFGDFFGRWVRGIAAHGALMFGCATLALWFGRTGGTPAALAGFAGILMVLIAAQSVIARFIGPAASRGTLETASRRADRDALPVSMLASTDAGFTGGIVGLPGAERVVIPEAWSQVLSPWQLGIIIERRRALVRSGARTAGLLFAAAFQLAGFALATALPGGDVTTATGLVTAGLWLTLWNFVGVLLLPAPTQRAALAGDALVPEEDRDSYRALLGTLDALQDDEPTRSEWVERIFHPVPALARRRAELTDTATRGRFWHTARTSLYLSIGCLGFLSRAVHCNAGRPELWAMLPCD